MGVKEDLVKLKGTVVGWTSTEDGYRGLVAGVLFVIGYFLVLGQLEARLVEARDKRDALEDLAAWVDEIRVLEAQTPAFEDRMVSDDDPTDWDKYLMDIIRSTCSEEGFLNFSERDSKSVKDYTLFVRELVVQGSFEELVECMDRIERGPRFVRIDDFSLTEAQGKLSLRMTVVCFAGETTAQRMARMRGGGPRPAPPFDEGGA